MVVRVPRRRLQNVKSTADIARVPSPFTVRWMRRLHSPPRGVHPNSDIVLTECLGH